MGKAGAPGQPGLVGEAGVPGMDGQTGESGPPGVKGYPGITGTYLLKISSWCSTQGVGALN